MTHHPRENTPFSILKLLAVTSQLTFCVKLSGNSVGILIKVILPTPLLNVLALPTTKS
jgi:hypothetical protein